MSVTLSDTQPLNSIPKSDEDKAIVPWTGNQAREATGLSSLEPQLRRTSRFPRGPQWFEEYYH